jgi:hypothetical protein
VKILRQQNQEAISEYLYDGAEISIAGKRKLQRNLVATGRSECAEGNSGSFKICHAEEKCLTETWRFTGEL